MGLRVGALEPLAEIFMALVAQARNHARPIKPRAAIVATLQIRKIELGFHGSIRNAGLRWVSRDHRNCYGAYQNESCSHRITLSHCPHGGLAQQLLDSYQMRVAAAVVMLSSAGWAQFKSTVPLVGAPPTVTDSKGHY